MIITAFRAGLVEQMQLGIVSYFRGVLFGIINAKHKNYTCSYILKRYIQNIRACAEIDSFNLNTISDFAITQMQRRQLKLGTY